EPTRPCSDAATFLQRSSPAWVRREEDRVLAVVEDELPIGRFPEEHGTGSARRHDRGRHPILREHLPPPSPRVYDLEVAFADEVLTVDEDAIVDEDAQVRPEPVDERTSEVVGVEWAREPIPVLRHELCRTPRQLEVVEGPRKRQHAPESEHHAGDRDGA